MTKFFKVLVYIFTTPVFVLGWPMWAAGLLIKAADLDYSGEPYEAIRVSLYITSLFATVGWIILVVNFATRLFD